MCRMLLSSLKYSDIHRLLGIWLTTEGKLESYVKYRQKVHSCK